MDVRQLADVHSSDSLSNRLRAQRFEKFVGLMRDLPRPVRIIDIGGTTAFWEQRGWAARDEVQIVTINLAEEPQRYDNIEPRTGDATDLAGIEDDEFDVAFSNSVIEHLFTFEAQMAMARETRRVAKAYWVQTPNYWFPMEPHFHVPGWQWMPREMRVRLIQRRRCGWRGPCADRSTAESAVDEVRLLSRRDIRRCFPTAHIWNERVFGLVKSFVALEGFKSIASLSNSAIDSSQAN